MKVLSSRSSGQGVSGQGARLPRLSAVIGVWFRPDGTTFYVKRSANMVNYPSTWSLFSIQYDSDAIGNVTTREAAQPLMEQMSSDRLLGSPINTLRFLTSGEANTPIIGRFVHLDLFQLEFVSEPKLNPEFYSESRWMSFEQYLEATRGNACGLCVRLWMDQAFLMGLSPSPYLPYESKE